jgi:adenylylsulfate kinase
MSNPQANNVVWQQALVRREDREVQNAHRSVAIWLTGLPCAGKSTLAFALEAQLYELGCRSYVLDGDNVRHGLCADLGFSEDDRAENIRRVGEATKLMVDAGLITLTAFISPFRADRDRVRSMFKPGEFIEVYCACAIEVCEARDVKGLYKRARAGEVKQFTGVSSPYEAPLAPEIVVDTAGTSLQESVNQVCAYLQDKGLILKHNS